jgi:hypothetical protein
VFLWSVVGPDEVELAFFRSTYRRSLGRIVPLAGAL